MRLAVNPVRPAKFTVRMRIPGWAQGRPVPSDLYAYDDAAAPAWSVRVGAQRCDGPLDRGFLVITGEWRAGDIIELEMALPVRTVRGHARIAATQERVAFERGPLVYCVEDVDFGGNLDALVVTRAIRSGVESRRLLSGLSVLTLEGLRAQDRPVAPLTAIPYFAWNNRGTAPMAVWLRRAP